MDGVGEGEVTKSDDKLVHENATKENDQAEDAVFAEPGGRVHEEGAKVKEEYVTVECKDAANNVVANRDTDKANEVKDEDVVKHLDAMKTSDVITNLESVKSDIKMESEDAGVSVGKSESTQVLDIKECNSADSRASSTSSDDKSASKVNPNTAKENRTESKESLSAKEEITDYVLSDAVNKTEDTRDDTVGIVSKDINRPDGDYDSMECDTPHILPDVSSDTTREEACEELEQTTDMIRKNAELLQQDVKTLEELHSKARPESIAKRLLGLESDSDDNDVSMETNDDEEDALLWRMVYKAFVDMGAAAVLDRLYENEMKGVDKLERRAAEIDKEIDECRAKLEALKASREKEEATQEPESDSDDDVQFVQTTYQPPQQMSIQQQLKRKLPPNLRNVVQIRQVMNERGETVIQYFIPHNTPNQEQLRQQLLQLRAPHHPPQNLRSIVRGAPFQSASRSQQPFKYPDLVVGMKLYGKKHTDIWHKGSLIEIQNEDRPRLERKYKLKFDAKGMKVIGAKHLAFSDHPPEVLPVGNRVIALYRDDEGSTSYYAGIVAEPPSARNSYRYLVFFDDGYAQYNTHKEIHKVCEQSANVWEDTYEDSRSFIEGYLKQYPERPMVRLQPGQKVKTEWNGKWWLAKVEAVDASLVKMLFETEHRTWTEWIYRGSTRLEPLYTELAHQEQSRQRGVGVSRRHFTVNKRKHVVEYLSGVNEQADNAMEDDDQRKKSVARKSTAKKPQGAGKTDIASVLQERLSQNAPDTDGHVVTTNKLKGVIGRKYVQHECSRKCLEGADDEPIKFRGHNCLLIPQLCGWERRQCWQKASTIRRSVLYRAPCGRSLRTINEVDAYLVKTNSNLTIDLFCFDAGLRTDAEFVSIKTFCDIKDLSYGKENVPISCVNGINRQYPEYVEYSTERVPGKGVNLGASSQFRVGCDCTDGCRDPKKCACIQLTMEASQVTPNNDIVTGYEHRRLLQQVPTGVYECNANCKCDHRCVNRVVQNGLMQRLQVFRTENKGWGIRALDDIPAGTYLTTYAGQLLTEQAANEDGQQFGDEYLAELDYIEIVERTKEGYESDVIDISDDEVGRNGDRATGKTSGGGGRQSDDDEMTESEDDTQGSGSDDSDCSVSKVVDRQLRLNKKKNGKTATAEEKNGTRAAAKEKGEVIAIDLSDEEKEVKEEKKPVKEETGVAEEVSELRITEPTSLNTDDVTMDSDDETDEPKMPKGAPRGPRRSTRAANSRFSNLPDPKSQKQSQKKDEVEKKEPVGLRSYYNEEFCYVMDAKSKGNIGRYLNHGCDPNVFVQNVFVDSHDLRFPWVAFFAAKYIKAGTELTWDYNYEVNSVPGKTLYCYCGSSECRGRLL